MLMLPRLATRTLLIEASTSYACTSVALPLALSGVQRCQSTASAASETHYGGTSDGNAPTGDGATSSSRDWASYDDDRWQQEDEQSSQSDREQALRRVLRSTNAAELAAVHFFRGYSAALHRRVDAEYFSAQEQAAADGVRVLLPKYRVRPSLAQGPLSLACMALGAAAGAAGPRVGLAVTGAVGDALTEHYNEQLRQLNEAGAAQQAPDVRQALRSLRDLPRTPEGAPPAPDLISLLQEGVAAATAGGKGGAGAGPQSGPSVLSGIAGAVREWGVGGTVGALVKAGAKVALGAASRL